MTAEKGKIQNNQSLKLWLEGKKIHWSQRQGKKAVAHIISQQKERTEKSHTTMNIILSKHTRTKTMKETIKAKQKRTQLRNKKHLETILNKLESVLDDIKKFLLSKEGRPVIYKALGIALREKAVYS